MTTAIIPQIKEITAGNSTLQFSQFFLSEEITQTLPVAMEIFANNIHTQDKFPITFTKDDSIVDEAYKITALPESITIAASTKRGLMYALYTLSELALANDDNMTDFIAYDEPALKFRGLSDDISRGQISTTENFFYIIRQLARYKYNTYMPYLEDVYKFASVPDWGKYSDPVSKEEWKVIIEYAKLYQMDVRPILNLLGHFNKLCKIKELQQLALKEEDGSVTNVMDPKNPAVREIILTMLDEIIDTFGVGVIHCGGDEPVQLTKVYGKEEGGELFIKHYTFIAEELKKRGCTLMMYADFFAPPWGDYAVPIDRAMELPKGTEFVFWDYAARESYPFISALHAQNLKMYISPGSWTWKRLACDMQLCFDNTKGLLKADNGRSLGMIMSSWADGGDTLRELTWPGVCIGGNFCWSPNSTYSFEEIYDLYHKSFFGFNKKQAAILEPIYHHDRLVERDHEHEFKYEMFANPANPVEMKDKEHVSIIQAAMAKVRFGIFNLEPQRNINAFNALKFSLAAITFTANKIMGLPHEKILTIEEGIPYSKVALELAAELLQLKLLHRKEWFATNRNSEWVVCECRYDDLYDQLMMFSRNVKLRKWFNDKI